MTFFFDGHIVRSLAFFISTLVLLVNAPTETHAHGGPVDEKGCHTNPRTGNYHCHPLGKSSRSSGSDVGSRSTSVSSFRSCAEARAAGAAPLRRGDPGYSLSLDRDRDGIACE
jgi:hypothetical protein